MLCNIPQALIHGLSAGCEGPCTNAWGDAASHGGALGGSKGPHCWVPKARTRSICGETDTRKLMFWVPGPLGAKAFDLGVCVCVCGGGLLPTCG